MSPRLGGIVSAILKLLSPSKPAGAGDARPRLREEALRPTPGPRTGPSAGQSGPTATREIAPPRKGAITITYAPSMDGDADAGEIIWTWVPYEEGDGRGKDRPVLVIARLDRDRVYAVRLTSRAHDGDRDFLPIGSGAWDPQGRESWVDVEQLYVVHRDGMRREAAPLDLDRFTKVAAVLQRRYGWQVGG